MKKRYMQPTMEVVEIETRQPMLAASGFSINNNTDDAVENGQQLSRRHGYDWDDDEDEEEDIL